MGLSILLLGMRALLPAALMLGAAAWFARSETGVGSGRSLGAWLRLSVGVLGLSLVGSLCAGEAASHDEWIRVPVSATGGLALLLAAELLPFVAALIIFSPSRGRGARGKVDVLWLTGLLASTAVLLLVRWLIGVSSALAELAGVWLCAGILGWIWARGRVTHSEADSPFVSRPEAE
jgi:hypothetical protein